MTLRISGKSISVGEVLRERVMGRTEEVLRKYFDGNYSGHITLSNLGANTRQGDYAFFGLCEKLGAQVSRNAANTVIRGPRELAAGFDDPVDMTSMPDVAPTLTITTASATGAVIDPVEVDATAALSSRGIEPIPLKLTRTAAGHYVMTGAPLGFPGQWAITVTVRTSDIDSGVGTVNVTLH